MTQRASIQVREEDTAWKTQMHTPGFMNILKA